MPFVKLDCGILTSTLWMDHMARELFITALLMAEPVEFDEPIPQIATRSLDLTGWSAPPGWYGFVPAANVGIIRTAGIDDIEAGKDALDRLASPDENSRSNEHEGRRLIRIDGGYLILNYMKYRDRDYTGAERQRRYRERKRNAVTNASNAVTNANNAVTNASNAVTLRLVTQAEAEAEEEAYKPKSKNIHRSVSQTDSDFAQIRAAYPKRAGNQRWQDAEKAYRARLKENWPHAEMLEGVERYAAFVRASGREGTEYVMQAATFFGKNRQFLEPWTPPPTRAQVKQDANIAASRAWLEST